MVPMLAIRPQREKEVDLYKKLKTEDQSYFEAKGFSEETSPGDPAPD